VQGRLVAAWPPVGLLLAYELLMQQIKARGGPGVQPSAAVPVHSLEQEMNDGDLP
jgi:hypothetical protein